MRRLFLSLVFILSISEAIASSMKTDDLVVQASNYQDFKTKFCSINPKNEKIFVIPSSVFKNYRSIRCPSGNFRLRINEPYADMGHYIYNIDPPRGVYNAFDCDGKADIGMKLIALNCYPVRKESVAHERN